MDNAIAITQPMVLVPLEKYEELLRETGEKPTPLLSKEITRARKEFRERKTLKWKKLKSELAI